MSDRAEPTFHCTRCGDCCRGFDDKNGVALFPDDVARISDHLNLTEHAFLDLFCNIVEVETSIKMIPLLFLRHNEGACVFLGPDNLCGIYEQRPIQCARAPFFFFWQGRVDFNHECVKDVVVPEGWSTEDLDLPLLQSLFGQ
jgi:Fe-S-cluster containining protein